MNTYLLTWNPDSWKWPNLVQDAQQTKNGTMVKEPWSCGNTKKIQSGDRLFLLKQGNKLPKGIIASGYATSEVYTDKHWDDEKASQGKKSLFVAADWDTILDFNSEPLLQVSEIDIGDTPLVNWNTMSSGISISLTAAERMELLWRKHIEEVWGKSSIVCHMIAIESELVDEGYFDPSDTDDDRKRKLTEIVQRRGQSEFRDKLIEAYEGRCAVSGGDGVQALEAAHIIPYMGTKSQHVSNGLLLRADIHTLFDLDLLGIDPKTLLIVVSDQLFGSNYEAFHGQKLRLPSEPALRPNSRALQQRWKCFQSPE